MYNVSLDRTAFASGREFINTTVTSQLPSNSFPAGTTDLFALFISQAETSWAEYAKYRADNYGHRTIFSLARRAATAATLAVEVAADMRGILRMGYHPLEQDKPTDEQRRFANEGARLLDLLRRMVNNLKTMKGGDETGIADADLHANLVARLEFAMHIADLGVALAKPANFVYHHPDAADWLKLRAATRRNLSSALIVVAKDDEAAAAAL